MRTNRLFTAMGLVAALTATPVTAGVSYYDWNGVFRMLDSQGVALANSSIPAKGANQFDTPISGTLAFDTVTGAGTATVALYEWGNGTSPFEFTGIDLQAVGDGMGGPGTLVLGNMLFNWNGNNDIPVSIVLDALGFFSGDLDGSGGLGATAASDGTYVGATVPGTGSGPGGDPGYLALGPIPIATTAWDTTDNCTTGVDCIANSVSGVLPLVFDNVANSIDYTANTGGSIGGSPMTDGPFIGANINLDFTDMMLTSFDSNASIAANCDFDPSPLKESLSFFSGCSIPATVPIPAAAWLFGSGLLGLLGMARRSSLSGKN